jgi:dipeptidyl aminopeptidase/acylaminoacyl peptidase
MISMFSVLFSLVLATAARALTAEDMFRSPQFSEVALSKSGRYLALTTPVKGRMNVMVLDLNNRQGQALTSYELFDVVGLNWVGDEHIVYSLGNLGEASGEYARGGGLFVISRDGKDARKLAATYQEQYLNRQFVARTMSFVRVAKGSTNDIIVTGNFDDARSSDLYRLNLETGRRTLISTGRPANRASGWVLDRNDVPRVVSGYEDDQGNLRKTYYRAGADAPWNEISSSRDPFRRTLVPLAVDADDKTLIVASNRGRDTMGIFKFDPETKQFGEQIAAHPRFDMGANSMGATLPGVMRDQERDGIIGVRAEADKPLTVWFDSARNRVQAGIDQALPNRANVITPNEGGDAWLVTSYGDTNSTAWYVYKPASGQLEEVGRAQPWLDGKLPEQRPMRFTTRDGLVISGYLFLPPDFTPGKPLPTVVYIHGGPHVRSDRYGGGSGVQTGRFLAANGFAVIVPNFRVTPGLGRKVFESGLGALGRSMSEDHEDALAWAVKEGYADPARACIAGASYGGYAALWAMVKTPELFKCAIAGVAVTDMVYQNTSRNTDYVAAGNARTWLRLLGVKTFDETIVKEISPVNYADKIKGAVFLWSGLQDRRVPPEQMQRMAEALTKAGNPPKQFLQKTEEGHGYGKPENRIELHNKMLGFLKEQLK